MTGKMTEEMRPPCLIETQASSVILDSFDPLILTNGISQPGLPKNTTSAANPASVPSRHFPSAGTPWDLS